MLSKERKDRLGQDKDVDDILSHPWFEDLEVDKLLDKKMPAPFKPKMEGKTDLRNFDPELTSQTLHESIVPPESIAAIKDKEEAFEGFGPMLASGRDKESASSVSEDGNKDKSEHKDKGATKKL